jgi:hypothetical protein
MASARRTGTNESKWSTPGGAGTWSAGANTFGAAGFGRDYTSLGLWETDTDVDLVTDQVSAVLECYADAASYVSNGLSIAGATTSATYRRILRAAATARHNGVPGAGVKFVNSTGGVYSLLAAGEAYCCIYDVEAVLTSTVTSSVSAIAASSVAGTEMVGLLVSATTSGAGGTACGIRAANAANDYRVANCIAYGCSHDGFLLRGTTARVVNCTAVGNGGYGFSFLTNAVIWINNIGSGNTGGDFDGAGATGTTHNLSSDTSAPGATNYRSKTLTFVNAAAKDYRLASTDTEAIGKGTSLAADATWAFDDDIAFTVRG